MVFINKNPWGLFENTAAAISSVLAVGGLLSFFSFISLTPIHTKILVLSGIFIVSATIISIVSCINERKAIEKLTLAEERTKALNKKIEELARINSIYSHGYQSIADILSAGIEKSSPQERRILDIAYKNCINNLKNVK